jgi:hypothetical protein
MSLPAATREGTPGRPLNAVEPDAAAHATWWLCALTVLVALAYLLTQLDAHWVPDDEGLLAHSAERVLEGQLPHRDFADVYTGGLSVWHALAFRVGGVDLLTLRYAIMPLVGLWLLTLFACARRFSPPAAAAVLTLLAFVWSVPNYPAAMPSWYSLFFATFGLYGLLRHLETGRRSWLLAAGVAGGLSILVKLTGLFVVAAALLYLVVRAGSVADGASVRDRLYRPVVLLGLAGFVGALVALLRQNLDPPHGYHFLLPGIGLAVVPAVMTVQSGGRARLVSLAADAAVLCAGVLLPLLVFAVPYVMSGTLRSLIDGVVVAPRVRLQGSAAFAPRPPTMAAPALLLFLLLVGGIVLRPRYRWLPVLTLLGIVAVALLAGATNIVYWMGWLAASQITPILVLAGCVLLLLRPEGDPVAQGRLYLAVAVAGLCSFVQFPFAAPIYFCFFAPLTVLAAAAVLGEGAGTTDRRPHAAVALLFGVFAVAWLNGRGEGRLWFGLSPRVPVVPLGIARASLRVPEPEARLYRALVAAVHQHARGPFIYAGPETPEIYFLAGRRNPTRSVLDFTDPRLDRGSVDVRLLRERGVTAVVINTRPKLSRQLSPSAVAAMAAEYPHARQIGRFLVRWRP